MRIALISVSGGRTDTNSYWPHYGLVLLSTILAQNNYEVRVFDQSFLNLSDSKFVDKVTSYQPDVVGVSLYTTHVSRGLSITQSVQQALPAVKLIAGGPHISLYFEDLIQADFFTIIVKGEAEDIILDVMQKITSGEKGVVIEGGANDPKTIPKADYQYSEGYKSMRWLPIQLSRGCPFNCSFCDVRAISSRRIRYRDVDYCLDEIEKCLTQLPEVHTVRIVDDCPTLNLERFKGFLKKYIELKIILRISIDNMRADCIDDELLNLLIQCGIPYICLAVESANEKVFNHIQKGEKLEDVRKSAELVRKKGLPLYLCFVIGLPHSTFAAEMDSLRFAKQMKAHLIYWNMYIPLRGTRAQQWYEEHGTIFSESDRFSVPDYNLKFTPPATESPEFSSHERIRAYLKCALETVSFVFTPLVLLRAFKLIAKYNLWSSLPVMLIGIPRKFIIYLKLYMGRFMAGQRIKRRTL